MFTSHSFIIVIVNITTTTAVFRTDVYYINVDMGYTVLSCSDLSLVAQT